MKFERTKLFIKTFLSSFPKKRFSLTSALSWFADFRQILSMCKLKFSLSSIVMPSMSTDGTAWICFESMINQFSVTWSTLIKYYGLKFIRIYNHFVLTKTFNGYLTFWFYCLLQAINSFCNITWTIIICEVMNWCN